jgi:hypothetical protein
VRLVRIPRHLLHVGLDDLGSLGVAEPARDALRGLLADLPMVPDASSSAQLIGEPAVTLPGLAVLARHVGQGLRDHNLSMAHDRARLGSERGKLVFLSHDALLEALSSRDERPGDEAVLFVSEARDPVCSLLKQRDARGLASFVTAGAPLAALAGWRTVDLRAG